MSDVFDLEVVAINLDVASELAPPGTDDYAILANSSAGLQVVEVNDPQKPIVIGTVPGSVGAERVLVEVQQLDRYLDEQGKELKETLTRTSRSCRAKTSCGS